MITLIKGGDTKILEGEGLLPILLAQGWAQIEGSEPKKKEVKNGKPSTAGN